MTQRGQNNLIEAMNEITQLADQIGTLEKKVRDSREHGDDRRADALQRFIDLRVEQIEVIEDRTRETMTW